MKLNVVRILAPGVAVWCLINSIAADSVSAAEPFDAFLTKHCLRCHGPKKVERELRIDRLSRDFKTGTDGHLWAEITGSFNGLPAASLILSNSIRKCVAECVGVRKY